MLDTPMINRLTYWVNKLKNNRKEQLLKDLEHHLSKIGDIVIEMEVLTNNTVKGNNLLVEINTKGCDLYRLMEKW